MVKTSPLKACAIYAGLAIAYFSSPLPLAYACEANGLGGYQAGVGYCGDPSLPSPQSQTLRFGGDGSASALPAAPDGDQQVVIPPGLSGAAALNYAQLQLLKRGVNPGAWVAQPTTWLNQPATVTHSHHKGGHKR